MAKKNILRGVNDETRLAAESLSDILGYDLTRIDLPGDLRKLTPEVKEDMKKARQVQRNLDRELNHAYRKAHRLYSRIETKYRKACAVDDDEHFDRSQHE